MTASAHLQKHLTSWLFWLKSRGVLFTSVSKDICRLLGSPCLNNKGVLNQTSCIRVNMCGSSLHRAMQIAGHAASLAEPYFNVTVTLNICCFESVNDRVIKCGDSQHLKCFWCLMRILILKINHTLLALIICKLWYQIYFTSAELWSTAVITSWGKNYGAVKVNWTFAWHWFGLFG